MSVFHRNLTGSDLHEPKGIDTAGVAEVYLSDGGGSGTWTPVSNYVAGAYCCMYLSPQDQTKTFATADVYDPFNLDYTTTPECKNLIWDNTAKEFTYNGDKDIVVTVNMSISIGYEGTGSPLLDVIIQKDSGSGWEDITRSISSTRFDTVSVLNMSLNCISTISPGTKFRFAAKVDEAGAAFTVHNINATVLGIVT